VSEVQDKILDLHNKCSKLTSAELIDILFQLKMHGDIDKRVIQIMKNYLARALIKEGFT